mmetsp:Transcript_6330/g.10994  ORF Transcript_6330/g.10994 Transcript_6330/m.10994 type:complete len:140 (-) Transcript_6330:520-939(-)
MDFTEVLQAESAADSSFRKIKRIQDKFKSRLSAAHTQYAKRILQMKRETIRNTKPLCYFDKKPSSIPPPQAPTVQLFTSFESSSSSSSSSSSVEWPEFHDFKQHVKDRTEETPKEDPIAELVRQAERLKEKYPRALSAK